MMKRLACLLLGHRWNRESFYTDIGRHVGHKKCQRCGQEEQTFTGPIFPAKANDPEIAVEYIEMHEDYDPPRAGGPGWGE